LGERALAIRKQIFGVNHPDTNRARCILASVTLGIGQAHEALALIQTALAAQEEALGPNHPWTKDSAHVTANALDALSRTEEATAVREKYGIEKAGETPRGQ
jgi:hypothetical protein